MRNRVLSRAFIGAMSDKNVYLGNRPVLWTGLAPRLEKTNALRGLQSEIVPTALTRKLSEPQSRRCRLECRNRVPLMTEQGRQAAPGVSRGNGSVIC